MEFRRSEQSTCPPAKRINRNGLAAGIWNTYGGAIGPLAEAYGIPVALALAVCTVEAGGRAYDPRTGLILVQFEDHVFASEAKVPPRKPRYGTQEQEWRDFNAAAGENLNAAFEGTSSGLFQIMGFNYRLAGYSSAVEMFQAFQRSSVEQVNGGFNFLKSTGLIRFVRDGDWDHFVAGYNGPGQIPYYKGHLLAAHAEARVALSGA